ncbi:MAG: efflux RND transporter permease subunit [Rhodospirillaceae bacterium]|nr:efflux RND transporter permease subunit [Rhodospirillaceae bacterium]
MSHGFSAWFIRRPVATVLMSIAIVLLGVFAFPNLPLSPMPQADFPTIEVNARLPGANPDTMASAVAAPLETAFTGISGITELTSSSTLNNTQITIQFELSRNIDSAAQEVQAAINSVLGRLPADMPNPPQWKKNNPTDTPVYNIAITSDTMPLTQLSDLADIVVARRLSQINGVSQVDIFGQRKPSIRIRANPERLTAYGLTLADIRTAVQKASVNQAKGAVYGEKMVSMLATNDQLFTPEEYGSIVISYRNNAAVLVRDVAKVEIAAENSFLAAFPYGKPGILLAIQRQPGQNIVAIAEQVTKLIPQLQSELPPGVKISIINDRTRTIRSSLHEVEITLLITLILVIGVMGLFLRQLSATMIVGIVLCVSIITTFAAMYLLGFSINNLTLVALVIAVGFVVDDAIVVVENIHRHMEKGESAYDAAVKGAREIGFTVVTITFSLIAAFIPMLFMGGIVGRLFREFSLTVTMSLLISVLTALSLAPMLCAKFMKPHGHRLEAAVQSNSRAAFLTNLMAKYEVSLAWALNHQKKMLAVFCGTLALAVLSYIAIPKGFFPIQDIAFVNGQIVGPEDISFEDMQAKQLEVLRLVSGDPAIDSLNTIVGAGSISRGRFFAVLKDPSDRDGTSEDFIDRVRKMVAGVPGVAVTLKSQQDINLGGGGGAALYSQVLRSANPAELAVWADKLTQAMLKSNTFRDVRNDLQLGARIQSVTIDRTAAARFGLTVDAINQALYDAFGQRQIAEFQTQENQYKVILEVDPAYYSKLSALNAIYMRSPTTEGMVPLSAVAKLETQTGGAQSIQRSGLLPAVNISFNLPKGTSLGEAVRKIEEIKAQIGLPDTVVGSSQGAAQAFEESLRSQPLLILSAIIAVYIILGILYESFTTPLTILSTLPSAGLGAVLMLWLFQLDFSIMALIGVILLIGIVKKNGILMVDFALDAQRTRGISAKEAVMEAALARFRPIIMTTIAAMLAAIPLMIAYGTGAELRQPLGVAVFGGLVVSQVLTLFSTPVIYITIDKLFSAKLHKVPRLQALLQGKAHPAAGVDGAPAAAE